MGNATLSIQRGIGWDESVYGTLVPADGRKLSFKDKEDKPGENVNLAVVMAVNFMMHVLNAAPDDVYTYVYKEGSAFGFEVENVSTQESIMVATVGTGTRTVKTAAAKKAVGARKVAPPKKAPAKAPVKRPRPAAATEAPARKAPAKKAAAKKATPAKKAAPAKAVATKRAPAKTAARKTAPAKPATGRKTAPPRKTTPRKA